jgi:hypothetical protein
VCTKDKKVALGVDGKLVDHTTSFSRNTGPVDVNQWDDWSVQGFHGGDIFSTVDGNEHSDFPPYPNCIDPFVIDEWGGL